MELEFNIAYNMRCELPIRSCRTITLDALNQRMTYSGLMEGTPNAELNDQDIEYALREADGLCVPDVKPFLIPPVRRDYLREPGDMEAVLERNPRHVPEWLPMVRCIGAFKSGVTARNPDKDWSVLVVVWFQDEFALPILEPALGQLVALDWDSLAKDVEY